MDEVQVVDAAEERWPDLERLFGSHGASQGCWCQYWLLGRAGYRRRDRSENKRNLLEQFRDGRAGLLAYRESEPVGWARLTPRADLPWVTEHFKDAALHPPDVWSLPCFYVARSARGSGVMRALIHEAVERASAGHIVLEAYPIDPQVPGATDDRYSGLVQPFMDEGFVRVTQLSKDRVLVRRPSG